MFLFCFGTPLLQTVLRRCEVCYLFLHEQLVFRFWTSAPSLKGQSTLPPNCNKSGSNVGCWTSVHNQQHPLLPLGVPAVSESTMTWNAVLGAWYLPMVQGLDIVLFTAQQPTGPWTSTTVYSIPKPTVNGVFCYAAKAHPELQTIDDELILSYVFVACSTSTWFDCCLFVCFLFVCLFEHVFVYWVYLCLLIHCLHVLIMLM